MTPPDKAGTMDPMTNNLPARVDTDATPTSIRLASGLLIDLLDPDPLNIRLTDIAASLARQERFNGHCPLHPTVAEHSLAVEYIGRQLIPDEHEYLQGEINMLRRALLMHDAVEAYVGDVSAPAKRALREEYIGKRSSSFDILEGRIDDAVAEVFGYAELSPGWDGLIHHADQLAYEYESSFRGWGSATPPDWVVLDPYVQRCYRPLIVDDMHDGGETKFLIQAGILGMR